MEPAAGFLLEDAVDGKPDTGGIGAGMYDPVLLMGRDEEVVAGGKVADPAAFTGEGGLSLEEDDPFVPVLVVPFTLRGGLAGGDDAFDPDPPVGDEEVELFTGGKRGREGEDVFGGHQSSKFSTLRNER